MLNNSLLLNISVVVSAIIFICAVILYLVDRKLVSRIKKVDDSIKKNEERFRYGQYFANVGTWDWDIQTGDLFWSERISILFGYKEGKLETTYENFLKAVHQDDRQNLIDAINACVEGGGDYDVEHRIVWPDGTIRWVSEKGDVIRNADGQPLRMLGVVQDITQRKEAELALIKSEEMLKQAQTLACIGNWSWDVESGALYWSDEIYRIFGRKTGEFEPSYERFFEAVHPDDVEKIKRSEEEAFSQGRKHSIDHRIILPGGEVRWVHEEAEAVLDAAGRPVRLQGTVHDITKRKHDEIERQKNHQLTRLITETQNQFLGGKEAKAVFRFLLDGMLKLTDSEYGFIGELLHNDAGNPYLKAHAISGVSWNEKLRALCRNSKGRDIEACNLELLFAQALETGKPVISNDISTDEQGAALPEDLSNISNYFGTPFYLGDKMVGIIGMANCPDGYDERTVEFIEPLLSSCAYIFDSISSEHALKESEAKFRALVDSSMDGVLLFDGQYIVDANPTALRLFGCNAKDDICCHHPCDFLPEYQADNAISKEVCREEFSQALSHRSKRFEWVFRRLDGVEFPTEISISEVEISGEMMFQLVIRDISDKKRAEKEKEDLHNKLLQGQKMEALGHLAGGIAHDFNNILTSIIGYADLGMEVDNAYSREELHTYLKEMRQAGRRAKGLIAQMLAFSRGNEAAELKALEFKPLINEAVRMLRPMFPSSIEIHSQLDENLPVVMSDPVQIYQVIMNLCINARDAIGECGRIDLRLASRNIVDATCASCCMPIEGEFVEIIVSDTGSGIDEDKLSQIFEPFFTTKEDGKGSGMGLSVVHGVTHSHSGHVLVNTKPGEGTEFRLLFPAATGVKAEAVESISSVVMEPRGGGEHILVVDDDDSVANFLDVMLTKKGYRVTKFNNSVKALSYFMENSDDFDLVITDHTMPRMTGSQMAHTMLTLRSNLPVILCTGYSKYIDKESSEEMGIKSFINKPVEVNELLESVNDLMSASSSANRI